MQQTKKETKDIAVSYQALDAIKDMVWLSGLYIAGDKANDMEKDCYYEAIAVLRSELGAALDQDI